MCLNMTTLRQWARKWKSENLRNCFRCGDSDSPEFQVLWSSVDRRPNFRCLGVCHGELIEPVIVVSACLAE